MSKVGAVRRSPAWTLTAVGWVQGGGWTVGGFLGLQNSEFAPKQSEQMRNYL